MPEKPVQKDIFIKSEGDSFFQRNKEKLETSEVSNPGVRLISKYLKPGTKILEIGCGTGVNLDYLSKTCACECYGIDPSKEAVAYGAKKYPHLHLSVGTSDVLDFPDNTFNVVIFGFCLYLVDPSLMMKSVAEADRVLVDGGYIAITDFDSKVPVKRPYKHYAGVYSHKMDYAKLFTVYPFYTLADKYCYSHSSNNFTEDIDERVSTSIVYKDHKNAYVVKG